MMKTRAVFAIFLGLFLCSFGGGAVLQPRKPERHLVTPLDRMSIVERFEGGRRAGAIVIGNGRSFMGVYVFDRHGNCVALDDSMGAGPVRDDLAVEWFPAETGAYSIEVNNFGLSANAFTLVVR